MEPNKLLDILHTAKPDIPLERESTEWRAV